LPEDGNTIIYEKYPLQFGITRRIVQENRTDVSRQIQTGLLLHKRKSCTGRIYRCRWICRNHAFRGIFPHTRNKKYKFIVFKRIRTLCYCHYILYYIVYGLRESVCWPHRREIVRAGDINASAASRDATGGGPGPDWKRKKKQSERPRFKLKYCYCFNVNIAMFQDCCRHVHRRIRCDAAAKEIPTEVRNGKINN